MQSGQVMLQSTVERFDLGVEHLALMVQNWRNEVLIGFETVCAIAHGGQPHQLLKKPSGSLE